MSAHLLEWLNLLLRWIHVITGIAWIGASFYFNWLEGRLDRASPKPDRIAGQLWAVHGGGFYHLQKYEVAPEQLPDSLHWFKWEAYTTWLSGFALLLLVYYLNPGISLLGANQLGLSSQLGVIIGLSVLLGGWLIYHNLARTPLVHRPGWFALVGLALATGVAFGLVQVFDARAAFMHVGAMIGTIMVANVLFVIIPAQRVMVDAMAAGEAPDPAPGKAALNRSLHNNYMTLPLVFIMVSHHYPSTFGHGWNWAILAALSFGSAGVRHYFNLRNKGQQKVWILPVALVSLLALALLSSPKSVQPLAATDTPVRFWQVQEVIDRHCVSCHATEPSSPIFAAPPLGLVLETPEQIRAAADTIKARAVVTQTMPLGNATGMTDAERELLGHWIAAGAEIQ